MFVNPINNIGPEILYQVAVAHLWKQEHGDTAFDVDFVTPAIRIRCSLEAQNVYTFWRQVQRIFKQVQERLGEDNRYNPADYTPSQRFHCWKVVQKLVVAKCPDSEFLSKEEAEHFGDLLVGAMDADFANQKHSFGDRTAPEFHRMNSEERAQLAGIVHWSLMTPDSVDRRIKQMMERGEALQL